MLTFEAIRELERKEKESRKMQKLPADLVHQISDYLGKKESVSEKTSSDIMELEKVKSAVKRFYESREKKLLEAALDAARTGMLPESLTPQEEHYFWLLVGALKDQREQFFASLSQQKANGIEEKAASAAALLDEETGTEEIIVTEKPTKPVLYKVLRTLPPFVGLDMSVYELKEGDIREIPKPLNELLLKEGVIQEAKEE